jgi:hypothetical protein
MVDVELGALEAGMRGDVPGNLPHDSAHPDASLVGNTVRVDAVTIHALVHTPDLGAHDTIQRLVAVDLPHLAGIPLGNLNDVRSAM